MSVFIGGELRRTADPNGRRTDVSRMWVPCPGWNGSSAARQRTVTLATNNTVTAAMAMMMTASRDGEKSRRQKLANATAVDAEGVPFKTVGEVMAAGMIYSCKPDTTVLDALELIVEHRISGLPVVDKDNKVVGVVSDFDLFLLDTPSLESHKVFPSLDESWQTFMELRKIVTKVSGKIVSDVMTYDPLVVHPNTSLDSALRSLVESKIRRLPVVDEEGKLVGMLTRRSLLVAALKAKRANESKLYNFGDAAMQY